ncbi:putative flocculation protein FLO11-like 4 [Homarus americanus]|uniref:Putative flocculation protein FLO11-like 4 n=1 Tax=Homarus americanus TaxID=6706 RepID=A0A8J5N7U3_HOMAM|nr:putative flocculation protein FLO11-like 4 [Homarus americanus]
MRQASKSTKRDHFSKLRRRLRQLGKMFMNQEVDGERKGEKNKIEELQHMVDSLKDGHIKQLEQEVKEWTKKLLSKDIFLEMDEEDLEEEEQRLGSALSSLMDALDEAENKLSTAMKGMETLGEFLDSRLKEMESSADESQDSASEEPTQQDGVDRDSQDPIEGMSQAPQNPEDPVEGTSLRTTDITPSHVDEREPITPSVTIDSSDSSASASLTSASSSSKTVSSAPSSSKSVFSASSSNTDSSVSSSPYILSSSSALDRTSTSVQNPSPFSGNINSQSATSTSSSVPSSRTSPDSFSFSKSSSFSAGVSTDSHVHLTTNQEKHVKRSQRKLPRTNMSPGAEQETSSMQSKKNVDKVSGSSRQLRIVKHKMEDESHKTKLEQKIKDRLQKLGLEKIGRKFEVKILTPNSLEDEDTNNPLLSQEETEAFQNMIVNLLSANAEELEERENHRKLEKNYGFKWDDSQFAEDEEE